MNGSRTVVYVYGVGGNLIQEYDTAAPAETGRQYLAQDMLGSTRVVFSASGTAVRCMDYQPFGEQIPQGVGGRPSCYATAIEPRQKFTGKERNAETGLDYFGARYYSGAQGRFTTPNPLMASANVASPQSWNRYVYANNSPLRYTDPLGLYASPAFNCSEGSNACNCATFARDVVGAGAIDVSAAADVLRPALTISILPKTADERIRHNAREKELKREGNQQ